MLAAPRWVILEDCAEKGGPWTRRSLHPLHAMLPTLICSHKKVTGSCSARSLEITIVRILKKMKQSHCSHGKVGCPTRARNAYRAKLIRDNNPP